jgi:hypothetical protein
MENAWNPTCPACRHAWQNHRPVEVPVPSTSIWNRTQTIYKCIAPASSPASTGMTERCGCTQFGYTAIRFDQTEGARTR